MKILFLLIAILFFSNQELNAKKKEYIKDEDFSCEIASLELYPYNEAYEYDHTVISTFSLRFVSEKRGLYSADMQKMGPAFLIYLNSFKGDAIAELEEKSTRDYRLRIVPEISFKYKGKTYKVDAYGNPFTFCPERSVTAQINGEELWGNSVKHSLPYNDSAVAFYPFTVIYKDNPAIYLEDYDYLNNWIETELKQSISVRFYYKTYNLAPIIKEKKADNPLKVVEAVEHYSNENFSLPENLAKVKEYLELFDCQNISLGKNVVSYVKFAEHSYMEDAKSAIKQFKRAKYEFMGDSCRIRISDIDTTVYSQLYKSNHPDQFPEFIFKQRANLYQSVLKKAFYDSLGRKYYLPKDDITSPSFYFNLYAKNYFLSENASNYSTLVLLMSYDGENYRIIGMPDMDKMQIVKAGKLSEFDSMKTDLEKILPAEVEKDLISKYISRLPEKSVLPKGIKEMKFFVYLTY